MKTDSIHGHDVMEMMLEMKGGFTKEGLEIAIQERFGEDARFHTCSAENMTAAELITLLEKKGKFIQEGAGFNTSPDKICSH